MVSLSYKSKQYLLGTLKVLILAWAFWYLYTKISEVSAQQWSYVKNTIKETTNASLYCFFFMALAFVNWGLEIFKWKTLASHIIPISMLIATKESLASFTISIITPNRIGEYGAKAMYYQSNKRKKVLVLNLFGNLSQLATTLFFGSVGLAYLAATQHIQFIKGNIYLGIFVILASIFLGYILQKKTWFVQGLSLQKIWEFITTVSVPRKVTVFSLAFLRYLIFSAAFYYILSFFEGTSLPLIETMAFIFSMYLIISLMPTLAVLDVAVKGSVAIWLFALIGISEISVLCTVLVMWVINTMFPAIIGGFFIANFKTLAP